MKKINLSPKVIGKQKKLLVFVILLSVVILGILSVILSKKIVNCTTTSAQAQQIFNDDPGSTPKITEFEKRYHHVEPAAQTCKSGNLLAIPNSKGNTDSLFFYRSMAIAAYSFGDYNDAKEYADKALALNEKVKDSDRGNKTKAAQVKAEMEAIKNDVY